ncbi:DUF3857 domain-containing protein [Aliivibrio kagoshimensis]|uniref:DUF3857 domain-containing protein n=1 Tax=Aliivibrio kagoshimensis TaxID=2910230 RepID=UPI003D0B58E8
MKRQRLLYILYLFVVTSLIHPVWASNHNEVKKSPLPAWVEVKAAVQPDDIPYDDVVGGVYYLLVDKQIKVSKSEKTAFYKHYADLIINQQGLEESSQIAIEFDPSYETLSFHHLQLIRDGKVINKLPDADINIIQRETELDQLIYDGRLTASIILNDVRVGDIIDYSYTLEGENPVYGGFFSHRQYVNWSVPVHQQFTRLLWGKKAPLNVTTLRTDVDIKQKQTGSFTEYSVAAEDSRLVFSNSETPDWYNPYGQVFFTEMPSWKDVVNWSLPLYQKALSKDEKIKAIADEIRQHSTDPSEQIAQALMYVQSEIRYLGIETGINSHQPSLATETLKRRYGDCKDKAVLLISILEQFGIKAYPALVHTSNQSQLAEYPAMINAFNHVIVKVEYLGKAYWLDPTRQYQKGNLDNLFQPNYQYALTIKPGLSDLEVMGKQLRHASVVINDTFDLSKENHDEVTFNSTALFYGLESERQRYRLAEYGLADLQKQYVDFWEDYYQSVQATAKLSIEDNSHSGEVVMKRSFALPKFWVRNEEERYFEGAFYPTSINLELSKPDQLARQSPYALLHPRNIKRTINIYFASDNWSFEDETFIEDNPFFYYKRQVNFDKQAKKLVLNYEYNSRTDRVLVEQFDNYLAARTRSVEHSNYGIVEYFKPDATTEETPSNEGDLNTDWVPIIFLALLVVYAVTMVFIVINWRMDARVMPSHDEVVFYPVSLTKIFFLTLVTCGFYPYYWFYRNWVYIKAEVKPSILPYVRAFFNQFLYWSLFRYLVKDSQNRFGENRIISSFLAVPLALLYLIIIFLSEVDYFWLPVLIVTGLLIFPLASYINQINSDQGEAYRYNSRWLLRHNLLSILFIPTLIVVLAYESHLVPTGEAISGKHLWSHDLKFMHRKNVFPATEDVVMFYSDSLWNIQEDGNGFTDNQVFSYWKEDGKFYMHTEQLSEIKDIHVNYSNGSKENTTVTIIRKDESKFILYVSAEEKLDKEFVKTLKQKWDSAKI